MREERCINCMRRIHQGELRCPYCGFSQKPDRRYVYALHPGTILDGRYLIGRVLGQGGFGITYVGFDRKLEMRVAIKEYFPQGMANRSASVSGRIAWNHSQAEEKQGEKGVSEFLKEARRMAKLEDLPAVVRVRDTFAANGTAYLVMEYIEGETLKSRIEKSGPLSFPVCVRYLTPVMDSLERMHRQGLIHRDISPDNIMIRPDGRPCLLDLGAAKDLTANTYSSRMVMKQGYSPLEQCTSGGKIRPWTDVYSMTATIYFSITGKQVPNVMTRAYRESLGKGADKTPEGEIDYTDAAGNPLPPAVQAVLRAGLEIHYIDRIQTMEELKCQLIAACNPPKPPEPESGKGSLADKFKGMLGGRKKKT